MAATDIASDWFHVVVGDATSGLEAVLGQNINAYAVNFASWEMMSNDRAEANEQISPLLNSGIDLIVVQLGENVSDALTFESDFEYLIQCIKDAAPDAQLIVVGNFWRDDSLDAIKKAVAERNGAIFIDLSPIQDNESYMAGMGTVVYGENGEPHKIEHAGVARHPNDAAMEWIAQKILAQIA